MSENRSETLQKAAEGYLKAYPQLYIGGKIEELIENAPDLTDGELEELGVKLFKSTNVAKLAAEGR